MKGINMENGNFDTNKKRDEIKSIMEKLEYDVRNDRASKILSELDETVIIDWDNYDDIINSLSIKQGVRNNNKNYFIG